MTGVVATTSNEPDPDREPNAPASTFEREVHRVVMGTSPGEVVSFGDVAHDAGRPRAARAVGALMARSMGALPWWRVVYADGSLPPCAPAEQRRRLRAEGVVVRAARVVDAPLGRFARSELR